MGNQRNKKRAKPKNPATKPPPPALLTTTTTHPAPSFNRLPNPTPPPENATDLEYRFTKSMSHLVSYFSAEAGSLANFAEDLKEVVEELEYQTREMFRIERDGVDDFSMVTKIKLQRAIVEVKRRVAGTMKMSEFHKNMGDALGRALELPDFPYQVEDEEDIAAEGKEDMKDHESAGATNAEEQVGCGAAEKVVQRQRKKHTDDKHTDDKKAIDDAAAEEVEAKKQGECEATSAVKDIQVGIHTMTTRSTRNRPAV